MSRRASHLEGWDISALGLGIDDLLDGLDVLGHGVLLGSEGGVLCFEGFDLGLLLLDGVDKGVGEGGGIDGEVFALGLDHVGSECLEVLGDEAYVALSVEGSVVDAVVLVGDGVEGHDESEACLVGADIGLEAAVGESGPCTAAGFVGIASGVEAEIDGVGGATAAP